MPRTGLGRGLDVLLGQTPTAPAQPAGSAEIPLDKIAPNPRQPRSSFPREGLAELAASIRTHGLLQPIVVARSGDGYELVAGHRRVLAARLAGRATIPAVVRDDVGDRLELALVENLQRTDLNAIETARAYRLLMETYGLTQEQLAERVGKSRPAVANTLRALAAPQPVQDALTDGRISEGHLRALLALPLSEAVAALATVIGKGLSVRATEALARKMVRVGGAGRPARPRGADPDLAHVTAERRKGGRIAIEYYSDDDFERIYELLVGTARSVAR